MILCDYDSPGGKLLLGVQGSYLCLCDWKVGDRIVKTLRRLNRYLPPIPEDNASILESAARQLDEYFEGKRKRFDLPLSPLGTEFQRGIWHELQTIPYGETVTYKEIAMKLGKASSVRAIANAVGANPISVILPCHRVVGSDGSLTGYAGGLEAKKKLLELEGILNPPYQIGFPFEAS